ncbi:hypothetical protein E4U21_003570 [Claviceps maximensis]|nr:hypothetical protein E4U21_003570 [Claviceps maximensis]
MADMRIIPFDPARHQHLFPSIVTLHVDAIELDDIPLRFHPPFTDKKREKLDAFWRQRSQQIVEGRRITLVAVAGGVGEEEESSAGEDKIDRNGIGDVDDGGSGGIGIGNSHRNGNRTGNGNGNGNANGHGANPIQSGQVLGIVELALSETETGSFRAEIEMLIVSPSYRRRGLATKLMRAAERAAEEHGKTLLTFSTTRDSVAEKYLYTQLGFKEFGQLPRYAITPMTGKYVDGVYFYKDLRPAGKGCDV